MIWALRLYFLAVLVAMLTVTTWAGSQVSLFKIPKEIVGHPWFIATLFDTYFAFLVVIFWVIYKEASWWKSALWFILICALGNIAIAVYLLIELFRVPPTASISEVLLRRKRP